MKKYIPIIIMFLFTGFGLKAQTFSDDNFIYTAAPKKAVQAANFNTLTKEEINQNVTYFDGLGRPIQTIAIGQGNNGLDVITPVAYDGFGRQVKEYLPYTASNGGTYYPKIDPTSAIDATRVFYNNKYQNTDNPFSEKKLEASPLNRVLKQVAPGSSWAMNSGHEIKLDYQTNTATDVVKLYRATANWQAGSGLYEISLAEDGTYTAGELYKTVTYDENTTATPIETAGATIEFKNKEGQVLLKRTYAAGDKHDTYYVYDLYGNLTYVLPPKVSGAINSDVLDGLCYQYKYDYRNRLVEKKLPGKQWEFIVYDKLDRPVATGPAFSPFKDETAQGWLITKYDAFGRPVYTGWSGQMCTSAARKSLQDAQNGATLLFESKETSGTIDGISVNYSNNIEPKAFKLLTVNYYDNYAYPNAPAVPTSIEGETVLANTKTLATGSWIRTVTTVAAILGETSTTFYDAKARPIGSYTQNHLGGYTSSNSKIDFSGKTLYTLTRHKRSSGDTEISIREEFTYTAQDRLLTHTHQINGGTVMLLAANEYDELGQLKSKSVGNSTGNPMQKVNFSYNIRGWLTEINKMDNLQQDTDPLDLFAFKLNYSDNPMNPAVRALYNGNIAETFWKTASDNAERGYGYQYDNLNRLTNAMYAKNGLVTNAYNESLSYDKNGNIVSLGRNGDTDPQMLPFVIDDLTYGYLNENSNLLVKVEESVAGNDNSGFKDLNKSGDDYSYDANGNMITDKNKNITQIQYNQLNLPKKISFGTTGTIEYIYNAAGQKLRKIVIEGAVETTTDYLGGFQYKDNVLQFFPTAEGYVKNDAGVLSYVFQYKDHLGNVRLSYAKNPTTNVLEIIEENNYYPFGLKHNGYNPPNTSLGNNDAQKYKFNGKELQDELGLGMYDYGARNYDPALGRWMNVDPKTEMLEKSSPYVYALNCPIVYLDRDGELPILINGRVSADSERASQSYWTSEIVATIQGSGIANPGGQIHYVDGDRYYNSTGNYNPVIDYDPSNFTRGIQKGGYTDGNDPLERRAAGRMAMTKSEFKVILSKLQRNSKGKIIEKIQIYTHSRGAAFGQGYTERLMELIKENGDEFADVENEIEFSYNMAPHQSWSVSAVKGVPTYSSDHTDDSISGNRMSGTKGAFTSNEGKGIIGAHTIKSFNKDLKAFASAFLKGGSSKDLVNDFVKTMKEKYNITVTVK
ncbi:DUF6443 domain-containing protein [Flavobacterium sp. Fl-77]|uniref:DUF6443 domain-containing protein n=1 Tax=Flavobacterium flavipigmentatum TaxID=2893884 RepID=A0AAJ2SA67_9FLAO|nr:MULTISPECIES: DUF6443 domain-containing protein [unclassified Flavobacterium]MDX6183946.1 DUF6443 domain-containing protein [Flavobacterium sp. Fl-33]MDX6187488.1 DUF6443 domain-containing protein [Flavobacterium sp. Fl-77]UFH37673.1 RHS repeat-associated core domain-containing protein [Flavobacterium sp. F-70]